MPHLTIDYGGCPVTVEIPDLATLAEQERCAVIAEKAAKYWGTRQPQDQFAKGAAFSSLSLAAQIRGRSVST